MPLPRAARCCRSGKVAGWPSTAKWTIQYGGHHLAVNITLSGSTMTLGPTL
nr:DUF3500 domain-containing protein [Streptomyces galbus]